MRFLRGTNSVRNTPYCSYGHRLSVSDGTPYIITLGREKLYCVLRLHEGEQSDFGSPYGMKHQDVSVVLHGIEKEESLAWTI